MLLQEELANYLCAVWAHYTKRRLADARHVQMATCQFLHKMAAAFLHGILCYCLRRCVDAAGAVSRHRCTCIRVNAGCFADISNVIVCRCCAAARPCQVVAPENGRRHLCVTPVHSPIHLLHHLQSDWPKHAATWARKQDTRIPCITEPNTQHQLSSAPHEARQGPRNDATGNRPPCARRWRHLCAARKPASTRENADSRAATADSRIAAAHVAARIARSPRAAGAVAPRSCRGSNPDHLQQRGI